MFCTKCGKKIVEGHRFCNGCGMQITYSNAKEANQQKVDSANEQQEVTQQNEKTQNVVQQPVKKQSKTGFVIGIIICAIVGILVGIGIIFAGFGGADLFAGQDASTEVVDDTEEKDSQDNTERTQEVDTAEVGTEAVAETATETTTEETDVVVGDYTEATCEELVADLMEQDVVDVKDYNTLFGMAKVLVNAKVVDEEGDLLSEMSDGEKLQFDYRIVAASLYEEDVFGKELEIEDYSKCDLAEAESLFNDTYGCNEVPDSKEHGGISVNGDVLEFMMADGDAWETIYNGSVRENNDYYLLTAPYFYGSNGQSNEEFMGYIDVLFVKNKKSRFGVTMLYAKTYEKEIEIDSIEVSSQLESQAGKTYASDNLFDGDYTTAWVEGEEGDGAGETITIYLSEPTQVHGLLLYNGYLASVDLYNKNGKVTSVSVDFGDGKRLKSDVPVNDLYLSTDEVVQDDYSIGSIYPQHSVVTDKIVITIEGGVAGNKYEDICISELLVY